MNDPDHDSVTALLNGLRPSAPNDDLLRRLAAARPIARTVVPQQSRIIAFIPRISMAAALLALAGAVAWKFLPVGTEDAAPDQPGAPATGEPALAAGLPLQSRQRLLSVQDLGIGRDARQQPVRLIQTRWLEDETITSPGNGPAVRQARVRDEIVPVAVSTH